MLSAIVVVVLAVLALLVPLLGDYYIHVFALVLINIILAASLRPSLNCGQLNIGHSAFMCVGAYTSALLAKHYALPFELTLLAGALLATVIGLIVGYPALRLRGVYFAMVTVAFVEVIRLIAAIWVPLTRGNSGLSGIPKPNLLGITLVSKWSQYYLALGLTALALFILWRLERSRLGLTWRSIGLADNLAQSLGVYIAAHKLLAFAVGCFLFDNLPVEGVPVARRQIAIEINERVRDRGVHPRFLHVPDDARLQLQLLLDRRDRDLLLDAEAGR